MKQDEVVVQGDGTNSEATFLEKMSTLPAHIMEYLYKRDRIIHKHYTNVDHHRHINFKRLRPCCVKDYRTKEVICTDPDVHMKNPATGKKDGNKHNRLLNGKGQPYHNDIIAGQLRLKRVHKATSKY